MTYGIEAERTDSNVEKLERLGEDLDHDGHVCGELQIPFTLIGARGVRIVDLW